jgi:hypothetical protein
MSELCVALLLKYLCCSFEALHKLNLAITFWVTFLITIDPKFILYMLIWMGQGLPPIQIHIKHVPIVNCFLEPIPKPFGYQC